MGIRVGFVRFGLWGLFRVEPGEIEPSERGDQRVVGRRGLPRIGGGGRRRPRDSRRRRKGKHTPRKSPRVIKYYLAITSVRIVSSIN